MKASLLFMLAKLAFHLKAEQSLCRAQRSGRPRQRLYIVLNTMIWDSVLNFLRFWKEGDSKAYRGFVPDLCHLSARGVVITRVSS